MMGVRELSYQSNTLKPRLNRSQSEDASGGMNPSVGLFLRNGKKLYKDVSYEKLLQSATERKNNSSRSLNKLEELKRASKQSKTAARLQKHRLIWQSEKERLWGLELQLEKDLKKFMLDTELCPNTNCIDDDGMNVGYSPTAEQNQTQHLFRQFVAQKKRSKEMLSMLTTPILQVRSQMKSMKSSLPVLARKKQQDGYLGLDRLMTKLKSSMDFKEEQLSREYERCITDLETDESMQSLWSSLSGGNLYDSDRFMIEPGTLDADHTTNGDQNEQFKASRHHIQKELEQFDAMFLDKLESLPPLPPIPLYLSIEQSGSEEVAMNTEDVWIEDDHLRFLKLLDEYRLLNSHSAISVDSAVMADNSLSRMGSLMPTPVPLHGDKMHSDTMARSMSAQSLPSIAPSTCSTSAASLVSRGGGVGALPTLRGTANAGGACEWSATVPWPTRRKDWLARVRLELPHKSKKQILEHENLYTRYHSIMSSHEALLTTWSRERKELEQAIKKDITNAYAIDEDKRLKEIRNLEYEYTRQCKSDNLSNLRKHKRIQDQIAEQRQKEEQRLEAEKQAKLEAIRRHRRSIQERSLHEYQQHREQAAKQAITQRQAQDAKRALQREQRLARNAPQVKRRVEASSEAYAVRRWCKDRQKEVELEAREARRESLRRLVRVAAPRDPARALQATVASTLVPKDKDHRPFQNRFDPLSYRSDQVFQDPRAKLSAALAKAGLLHSTYARRIVNALQGATKHRPDMKTTNN